MVKGIQIAYSTICYTMLLLVVGWSFMSQIVLELVRAQKLMRAADAKLKSHFAWPNPNIIPKVACPPGILFNKY